jgi:hypothetical protein
MVSTGDFIGMNRYCVTTGDGCPQVQGSIPDGRRSARRHTRPLLASMSLLLLTVISAAPEVPGEVAPYLKPQRLVRIAEGARSISSASGKERRPSS